MILDTIMVESAEIPDYDIMMEYPLNPARRAYWRMRDDAIKNRRMVLEVSSWHNVETMCEVIEVKSEGLEKWE